MTTWLVTGAKRGTNMAQKVTEKKKLSWAMPNRRGRRKPSAKLVTPGLPKQYRKKEPNKWIIHHLTATDLYKFSMGQLYFHRHRNVQARWEFKLRSKGVRLDYLHDAINRELDHLCTLRFTDWELTGIGNVAPWIDDDFLRELKRFQLQREYIHCEYDPEDECGLKIWAEGPQMDVYWFEIYVLQIVQHLYFDDLEIDWETSKRNLAEVIKKWKEASERGIKFTVSDFGIRRGVSDEWNEYMVSTLLKELPGVFVGTSNVYLAIKLGCKAIGTFAHALYAVYQGLDDVKLRKCQTQVFEDWMHEFGGDLGIALSDNFGFNAFLEDFGAGVRRGKLYAKVFDGCRHDSGNPYTWGEMLIAHYKKLKIDPATKVGCWSDSLDVDKSIAIAEHFNLRIKIAFGIGTFLSASIVKFKGNVERKPLSMVMKVVKVKAHNDAPWVWAVKLSDSIGKTMCPDQEHVEMVKRTFNYRSIDEVQEVCQ